MKQIAIPMLVALLAFNLIACEQEDNHLYDEIKKEPTTFPVKKNILYGEDPIRLPAGGAK